VSWDTDYQRDKRLWGDQPSELASFAVAYLEQFGPPARTLNILDIGCGYGRDVFYLSRQIRCRILGIDISPEAVRMATEASVNDDSGNIIFECRDYAQIETGSYNILFISNLYHLLKPDQRSKLREAVSRILPAGGLIFLGTLSVNDPEHYGLGRAVTGEENSFIDEKYLHLCTREELERDFGFLTVRQLIEREYDEPRATGRAHHHISWFLAGQKP
jgi:SAM-dependent methyltransferase